MIPARKLVCSELQEETVFANIIYIYIYKSPQQIQSARLCSLQKSEGIDANFPSVFGPAKVSGMQATRSLDIICVLIRVSSVLAL